MNVVYSWFLMYRSGDKQKLQFQSWKLSTKFDKFL